MHTGSRVALCSAGVDCSTVGPSTRKNLNERGYFGVGGEVCAPMVQDVVSRLADKFVFFKSEQKRSRHLLLPVAGTILITVSFY